jgi:hypothetical protein
MRKFNPKDDLKKGVSQFAYSTFPVFIIVLSSDHSIQSTQFNQNEILSLANISCV